MVSGMDIFTDLVSDQYIQIAITIVVVLVLRVVLNDTITRLIRRAVISHKYSSPTEEKQREDTLIRVTNRLSHAVLYVVALIVILYQMDVNVVALLTGLGAIGVFVGFGAQSAIRNYVSGFFVLFENQYRVNDIIGLYAEGANVFGVVEDISMRVTKLRDLDGNLHIVQNGTAGPVTNMSQTFANVNVDIGMGYDDDLDTAIAVINKVGLEQAGDDKFKHDIVEPIQFYRVDGFAASSVTLKALGKVAPATQWAIAGDYRYRIFKAFGEAHIDIPVPQVVVGQPRTVTSKTLKQHRSSKKPT